MSVSWDFLSFFSLPTSSDSAEKFKQCFIQQEIQPVTEREEKEHPTDELTKRLKEVGAFLIEIEDEGEVFICGDPVDVDDTPF